MVMVMVIYSALVRSHQSTSLLVASASCVPRGYNYTRSAVRVKWASRCVDTPDSRLSPSPQNATPKCLSSVSASHVSADTAPINRSHPMVAVSPYFAPEEHTSMLLRRPTTAEFRGTLYTENNGTWGPRRPEVGLWSLCAHGSCARCLPATASLSSRAREGMIREEQGRKSRRLHSARRETLPSGRASEGIARHCRLRRVPARAGEHPG